MANTVYALMVRDMSSGIDRSKIDDTLAGVITIDTDDHIAPLSQVQQHAQDGRRGPPVPTARDMDELREKWGADPSAIREKLKFDRTIQQLPPLKR